MRPSPAVIVLLFAASLLFLPGVSRSAPPGQTSTRQAIEVLNQKEAESCRTMDNSISKALWAEDGVDLIQGLQPMVGKKAISDWLDSLTPQLKGTKVEYCTIDWHDLKIDGDWAYEWAITRQKIDPPAPQKPFESAGKMVLILRRQPDGAWKIEIESWNSLPTQR